MLASVLITGNHFLSGGSPDLMQMKEHRGCGNNFHCRLCGAVQVMEAVLPEVVESTESYSGTPLVCFSYQNVRCQYKCAIK